MNKHTSTILITLLGLFLYGKSYSQTTLINEPFSTESGVSSTTHFNNAIPVSSFVGRLQKGHETLTSRVMPLSGNCSELTLNFDHFCTVDIADQAVVQYRLNGASGTWTTLTSANYFSGWSNYADRFTEASYMAWGTNPFSVAGMQTEQFKLLNLNGATTIEIRFKIEDLDGNTIGAFEKWYLDNILLVEEAFNNNTIGFETSSAVCSGTQLTISGLSLPPCIDHNQVEWTISDGTNSTIQTGYTPNYTFSTAGSYNIILKVNGTTYSTQSVTASNSPGSLTIVESTTDCGQVEITFPTGVYNSGTGRMFTYGDGSYDMGTPNSAGTLVHTYTANGTYTVSYTSDALSCPIYGTVTVTGLPESSFSYIIPDECDYTQGITLTIPNFDPATYNYQWEINGSTSFGATAPTDTYTQGLQAGNNTVKLKVFSNGYVCEAWSSSVVNINGALTAPLFTLPQAGFCEGEFFVPTTLTNLADNYNWTFTSPSNVVTTSTSKYPQLLLSEVGNYTIALEATIDGCPNGTVTTQETVTVSQQPNSIFSITPSTTVCGEYEVVFNNTPPQNATINIDYGDGSSPTSSYTHAYASNGIYEVIATISNGACQESYSKNVNVNVGATVTLTATDLYICDGVSTTLTANVAGINGAGNLTYTWSFNGTPTPSLGSASSIVVSAEGSYSVGIGSSNGICFLGNGNEASIYITKALVPQASVSSTSDAGCGTTGEAVLAISNFEAIGYNLYGDVSLDNTITLDELSAGTYNITIASEHNHNCFSTTPVTIDGSDLSVAAVEVAPSNCTTNTGEIAVTTTGGESPFSYTITNSDNVTTGFTGSTVDDLAPDIYTVTVTDGNNCSASTIIQVNSKQVDFTLDQNNYSICTNDGSSSVTVQTITNATLPLFFWYQQSTNLGQGASYTFNNTGTYAVAMIEPTSGCSASKSFIVDLATPVSVSIASDGQQCIGNEAVVTATLSGGTYDYITWTNATPNTDPLTATVTNFPATVSASIDVGGCTYQSNAEYLQSTTQIQSALTGHYDDTQDCIFTSQATGGTAPYTYNWYLQGQDVTTYGDPSDPTNNTVTLEDQEILQVSFSENTSINSMVDGYYRFEIVDANGCSVSYGDLTNGFINYTVPDNTAWHPEFSFVWGEEEIEEEEENEEIDEVLRENMAEAANSVMEAAGKCYQNNVAIANSTFRNECFSNGSLKDELSISYNENIHHYTLFYYDRAGMLTQTVPPEGVHILDETETQAILDYRSGGTDLATAQSIVTNLLPDHNLRTHYWYNNLGQMIRQETPDGGITNFIYDNLSRLRFSQNARQAGDGTYSYTKYDALGRVIEAGQSTMDANSLDFTNVLNPNNKTYTELVHFPNSQTEQVTHSVYTTPAQITYYGQAQRYLQNRISYVYSDYDGDITTTEDQYYTYYSYDPHGNVEWLVQDDPEIGKNYIAYEYDLISGNVLKVRYNEQRTDRFYHRYSYDAENRLTGVETSINGEIWDQDATYDYYKHGPLMRTVIGEDKVQGIDYAYTIQGWLKAVNTPQLHRGVNTMNNDGNNVAAAWETHNVAKDAYGMTLGYFQGDYQNTTHNYLTDYTGNTGNLYASANAKDLYNGNISHWINSRLKKQSSTSAIEEDANYTNATVYRYDILNRIKESWNYEQDKSDLTNGFQAGYNGTNNALAFHTNYKYDGNGNLEELNRYNDAGVQMDELSYGYNFATNGRLENNRLASVNDGVSTQFTDALGNTIEDIVGNRDYTIPGQDFYDEIGNLIHEVAEEWIDNQRHFVITDIDWNVSGKIKSIKETIKLGANTKQFKNISFEYDPLGNRINKTVKTNEYLTTGNYNSLDIDTYDDYPLNRTKTTYYVRDAQGNPMAVYTKDYDEDDGGTIAKLWLQEQTIYGSDRVGVYSRPKKGEALAELIVVNGEEVSFEGMVETGIESISEYQNWITSSLLPSGVIEDLCQCDIKHMKFNGTDYTSNSPDESLTSFLGIADQGIAVAENIDYETQFYAVLAKNYLGNEDACLVYDKEGNLMKGVEQITDVNMNSKPVIVNLTGTNKYALITLTNQGIPTYHVVDMSQNGYGGATPMGEVTNVVNQPLTSLTNTTDIQYGYHYTGYEDHVNNKTIVYTTRTTALAGQSEKLVEIVAIELAENTPITEYVLWNTIQCGDGDMGELQIAPNGEKLVWYSHGKSIAGFDHKEATIYEIALNSDKISSTGIVSSQALNGGSYAPLSGVEYETNSQEMLVTQHDLYNSTTNTSGAKLWKYDQLNLSSLPLTQNLVYLLGDLKRGMNGTLYIPNVNQAATTMHSYTAIGSVAENNPFFNSTASQEVLAGTMPTQVYKIVGNTDDQYFRLVGYKSYELKDHLGNVRAVISDHKILEDEDGSNTVNAGDYYSANIISYSDYYPFGMLQPNRHGGENYRYNFQGQETDDEVKGKGNSVNYKYRMHDPRLGRFFAVDPLSPKYPQWTPYQFGGNQVIASAELEGLEPDVNLETTSTTTNIDSPIGNDQVTSTLITGVTPNPVKAITPGDEQPHWQEGTTYEVNGQMLSFHMGITNESGERVGTGWYNTEDYLAWATTLDYPGRPSLGYSYQAFESSYSGEYDGVVLSFINSSRYINIASIDREILSRPQCITMVDGPESLLGPGMLKLGGKGLGFLVSRSKSLFFNTIKSQAKGNIGSLKNISGSLDDAVKLARNQPYGANTNVFRRVPSDALETLTMNQAHKGAGIKLNITLGDPRYVGWEKWQHVGRIYTVNGQLKSTVHYLRNPTNGFLTDFKFK